MREILSRIKRASRFARLSLVGRQILRSVAGLPHVHKKDADIIQNLRLAFLVPSSSFPAMASSPFVVFPLSPPSSGNVSPDHLVSTAFRHSRSLTCARQLSNLSDSEGYSTETSPPLRKRTMSRVVTLSSGSIPFTRAKSSRSLHSISGSDDSSSSSTPTDNEDPLPTNHNHNPAIGRKVAASLDLFKETTEELPRSEPSSRVDPLSARITEPFQVVEDVPEAFEFVKRSEWADRENAAIRRERSATTLDNGHVADLILQRRASLMEPSLPDVAQWRKDVATARGRRREREPSDDVALSAAINNLHNPSVRYIPQSPLGYPPSPSPSRSPPAKRFSLHHLPQGVVEPFPRPLDIPTPRHSRLPSPVRPIHEKTDPPLSSLESISPWTTDDESNWDTTSATPTVPTDSSRHGFQDDERRSPLFLHKSLQRNDDIPSYDGRNLPLKADTSNDNPVFGLEERLPHIPLQPFRNKVGGHSAIYKFTKQAVCKVRIVLDINFHLLISQ